MFIHVIQRSEAVWSATFRLLFQNNGHEITGAYSRTGIFSRKISAGCGDKPTSRSALSSTACSSTTFTVAYSRTGIFARKISAGCGDKPPTRSDPSSQRAVPPHQEEHHLVQFHRRRRRNAVGAVMTAIKRSARKMNCLSGINNTV